ncbi:hypothetical protein [Hyalangium rubrum]|uniref:Lipoprotein n=1 Tax=Hyalangium rubrum TaxID=3103134 RepID=A0ABU5HCU3_9BACT|nr:hypothetical protein [Hyalangium sp. s54d21]MDY7230714.1 hypothetical protein [Hyalangium sp. s54d21]
MTRAVSTVCLLAVMAVVGCVVSVSDFAGKSCEIAEDCPEPYVCVAARAGAGRTCEALAMPEVTDGGRDDGPIPTYCAEIQPILAANCISSCHGADTSGSNRIDFRLDYYEPDAGQPKGAKNMAPRIKQRALDFQDMPPPGNPEPSAAERVLLGRWATGGAPFCDDGGVSLDGGTDGGP